MSKTRVFFSKNVSPATRSCLSVTLSVSETDDLGKYL